MATAKATPPVSAVSVNHLNQVKVYLKETGPYLNAVKADPLGKQYTYTIQHLETQVRETMTEIDRLIRDLKLHDEAAADEAVAK